MQREQLIQAIFEKGSFLCVGLDTSPDLIPSFLHQYPDPELEFNRRIIEATLPHCVAYKPNLAFYEAQGPKGWNTLARTLEFIPNSHFTIADAKRGDIGNTGHQYAKAFFETLSFDAITVAPYMGFDSVRPFLEYPGKWVILLLLTSNSGSKDFQLLDTEGKKLYEQVLNTAVKWGTCSNLMFVVGATHPTQLADIRGQAPDYFFLVPGVGAQGGSLKEVAESALTPEVGLLVNSSRQIIYAGKGEDFAQKAGEQAAAIHEEMKTLL